MLCAAVLTVLLTAAGAQVAKFEFPVTKESVLFITHAPDNKQSSLMKTAWCDGFYLICELPSTARALVRTAEINSEFRYYYNLIARSTYQRQ
jgi:hypothetical protein